MTNAVDGGNIVSAEDGYEESGGKTVKEIRVNTQNEWDALPDGFEVPTRIVITGDVTIRNNKSRAMVEARGSSRVEAWGSSRVVARGSSSVVAWGQSIVRVLSEGIRLVAHGLSIVSIPVNIHLSFNHDESVTIHRYTIQAYLDRGGVEVADGAVVLFKRVSNDFKTQEGKTNETEWKIGTTVTHKEWEPTLGECGKGKFHACSRPYFCDEFRSKPQDRYVAIQIKIKDLYEWPDAQYPHKVAFREGRVLYECDKFGRKVG